MAPVDARKKLEQLRRQKGKNPAANVRDLRQVISNKKRTQSNERTPNKTIAGRVTKHYNNNQGPRDLRETSRSLAARRVDTQPRDNQSTSRTYNQLTRGPQVASRVVRSTSYANGRPEKVRLPQQQYYVPPHVQAQQPTWIIHAPAALPQSTLAMDSVPETQCASVLVSNLMPTVNQADIIELFGNIGTMTGVNMINQTTALVTFQNSSDAVSAVQIYHNRLLDGKPMLVNMMPNSNQGSNVRSRIGNPPAVDVSYSRRL